MDICQLFTKSNVLLNKLLSKHLDPVTIIAKQIKKFLMNFQKYTKWNWDQLFGNRKAGKRERKMFILIKLFHSK